MKVIDIHFAKWFGVIKDKNPIKYMGKATKFFNCI
jgi:hypothetical protein